MHGISFIVLGDLSVTPDGDLRQLMMADTDLMIMDADTNDSFDFFPDHYNEQLVAGYSRNTSDHGLLVVRPDYRSVGVTRASVPLPSIAGWGGPLRQAGERPVLSPLRQREFSGA